MGGRFEIMDKLAQFRADLEVTDSCGRNAYDYAVSFGMSAHENIESFKEYFKKNGLSGTNDADSQSNYDDLSLTKFFHPKNLLTCRANCDLNGWGPLHYAVRFSNQDMVRDLVQEGLPLDTRTKSGYNLLHLAAANKNIAVLNFVLETMRSRNIPVGGNNALLMFTVLISLLTTAFSNKREVQGKMFSEYFENFR